MAANSGVEFKYSLEAERGDTPLLPSERMWGFWEFTYANCALAIATWAFLIGGATALFVGPREGIAAIVIGNIIGVLLATFSTCVPCGKYGTEQFTFVRTMFGSNGSRLVYVLAVVFLTMGWLAVLGLMFGRSIDGVAGLLSEHKPDPYGMLVLVASFLAILVTGFVVAKGPTSIKVFNTVVAPALIVIMGVMLYMILSKHSWAEFDGTASTGCALPRQAHQLHDRGGSEHGRRLFVVALRWQPGQAEQK